MCSLVSVWIDGPLMQFEQRREGCAAKPGLLFGLPVNNTLHRTRVGSLLANSVSSPRKLRFQVNLLLESLFLGMACNDSERVQRQKHVRKTGAEVRNKSVCFEERKELLEGTRLSFLSLHTYMETPMAAQKLLIISSTR